MRQPTPFRPPEPATGDVWDLDFDPQVGREQGGRRPALVISNNGFNVPVDPPDGGLTTRSIIMCEQAKSVSIERFVRYRGRLAPTTVKRVQTIVAEFLDR